MGHTRGEPCDIELTAARGLFYRSFPRPDVLIFYSFIYIVSAVGLATRVSPAVYRVMHRRPSWTKSFGPLRGQANGTILMAAALVALTVLWTA